jgi:hypothetical protein
MEVINMIDQIAEDIKSSMDLTSLPRILELYDLPARFPLAWEMIFERRYFAIIQDGKDVRHVVQNPETNMYSELDYETGFELCAYHSPIYC